MAEFFIGCDPALAVDYTAFAIVSTVPRENAKPLFQCGHLERLPLNTAYPAVVAHAQRLFRTPEFHGRAELVLDLTGIGRPVADMFHVAGMKPVKVLITGGNDEHFDKDTAVYHVPKLVLVSTVQALLHDGRLQIQSDLPMAPILRAELEDFRAVVTDSGRWTFGARSGAHDDLVLALALACWRANRRQPMQISPDFLAATARLTRPMLGGTPAISDSRVELQMFQARALSRTWQEGR
jgi:hypothetical protein